VEAKVGWRKSLEPLRQRLILTREEKRVIIFLMAALALGFATKCYRDAHPPRPAVKIEKQHSRRR
jgi:hypothetical protein